MQEREGERETNKKDGIVRRTASMGEYERVLYQLIKDSKNNGIWVKDLKTKSGLHTKVVNSIIKNMEKKNVIKFVKPVNNPHKKMYLLVEYSPSENLTGGAWYTDNEFDINFIEQLSIQIFRYVAYKTVKEGNDGEIYYTEMSSWPSTEDVLDFVTSNKIITFSLGLKDAHTLLHRLCLDSKLKRVIVSDSGSEPAYVYAATALKYADAGLPYPFHGIPCRKPSYNLVEPVDAYSLQNLINCSQLAQTNT